jgi:protein TonB
MVPPEELEMAQPTTLPADFSEWDSGEAPAAQPAKPATARVAVPPAAERAHSKVSFSPAKVQPEVEKLFQPRKPSALEMAAEKQEVEDKGKRKPMVLAGAVGSLIILLALGSLSYYKFRTRTIVLPPPVAALPATNTSMPVTANLPAATTAPATAASEPDRPNAQAVAMSHQLNAPSRIPNDLRMLAGKEPPPSSGFVSAGMEGLGGTPGNVFNGQNGPKVKIEAPRKMSISAGVAGGLLVQRTTPVYPQIAKEARVSGTVVLQATISKAGLIENLRVISGPTMLRQSAQDAVKSWRYRPYMLDGAPVEVETTVNVTFTLGG